MADLKEIVDEAADEIAKMADLSFVMKNLVKDTIEDAILATLKEARSRFSADVEYSGTDATQVIGELEDSING